MTTTAPWFDWTLRMFGKKRRRYDDPGQLAAALDPKYGTSPALAKIDEALVDLMDPGSEYNALAVFMPPQEGKSQKCSRSLPEWLLDADPSTRIAIVSYEQDMALRWGRDIKQDVTLHPCESAEPSGECDSACGGLHIAIRRDSSAAGRWETVSGGGIYCVGVGGPLTGRPVDVLIIDDPVKDRAAAESQKIRDSTWDWWESVALTRLAPNARCVLIQTRWHEDDLAGRIFSRPSPLKWRKIVIPAIAGDRDELGREPGEELESVRHRVPGFFRNLKATMSAYVFSGVYQQSPTAPEGNFFRRQAFRYWRPGRRGYDGKPRVMLESGVEVTLADCWRFATMDFAGSTKDSADYTVCAIWAVTPDGDLILLDRARDRVAEHDHFTLALPLLRQWQVGQVYVEKNYYAKTFVTDARDRGIPVAPLLADTDKVTRAIPAAGRCHSGKVYFPAEAEWLDVWTDELAIFPQGTHDDQVDVLSYAARIIVSEWTPAPPPARPGVSPYEAAINAAASSATGDGHGDLDIMSVPY